MVKKNNIVIPKSLTPEEVAIRLEANAIKVKLLEKDVWAHFSKDIVLKKNRVELTQEFFNCSKDAAEYLISLSLAEFMLITPEMLEEERKTLEANKEYTYPQSTISQALQNLKK